MKLAELLNERKAVKEEIKNLKGRLYLSAKMQEGDAKPVEPPEELKGKLIDLYEKLHNLIIRINDTNVHTMAEGKSLMELISERDCKVSIAAVLHEAAEHATPKAERFSRNEIRYVASVDIKEIRKEADTFANAARQIDNKIQSINWNTEV